MSLMCSGLATEALRNSRHFRVRKGHAGLGVPFACMIIGGDWMGTGWAGGNYRRKRGAVKKSPKFMPKFQLREG